MDTATAAGAGIVADTIQYHGAADRYSLTAGAGTQSVATSTPARRPPRPSRPSPCAAVGTAAGRWRPSPSTCRGPSSRPGRAILPGPGQERDGQNPIRSDDLFFGGSSTDWVNLDKVAIPQADEQQRLLANLIQVMNRDRKPLPRFWYFPRSLKAVVVGTGDDHGNGGTSGRFNQYLANSPAGCSVADWTCLRFCSYVYPGTPLSDSAARRTRTRASRSACTPAPTAGTTPPSSIATTYSTQLAQWRANYPSLSRAR